MNSLNDRHQSHSSTEVVFKLISLLLIFFVSLIGNILLAHFASKKGYRKTGTNTIILSQTIADLGTTCFVIPFAVPAVFEDRWTLGDAMCRLNGFCNMFFTIATLYNLSFLAYDRFLVIVHKSHQILTRHQARKGTITIWLIALAISFPWMDFANENIRTVYTPGFYICYLRYYHPFGAFEIFCLILILLIAAAIPTGIILYSFYRILVVYRDHRVRITPVTLSNVAKFALEQYCRSAYTSLLMIGTTMLFVLPSCFTLFIESIQVTNIPHSFETASKWVMWCHCTVKPIIYLCRSRKWRNVLSRYFRSFFQKGDTFNSASPLTTFRACVTSSDASKHNTIIKVISDEEIAKLRKDLGLAVPTKAWSNEFLDVCAR